MAIISKELFEKMNEKILCIAKYDDDASMYSVSVCFVMRYSVNVGGNYAFLYSV